MIRMAVVMDDYRYSLTRKWGDGPQITWIMLNPSLADGNTDDATMRRVIDFSQRFTATTGEPFGKLVVVNLFALRTPHPSKLAAHDMPVGDHNTHYVTDAIIDADTVVAAWGGHTMADSHLAMHTHQAIGAALEVTGHRIMCLGTNLDGSPCHPLYLAKDTPLKEWIHG